MAETNAEAREKITELVRDAKFCMLTTMTADGRHVGRPMGLQEAEFDGDLWFFADATRSSRRGSRTGSTPRGLTLIKVHAESAEYWDAPNSKVVTLIGYAKAAVTGKRPDPGENREVSYPP